MFFVIKSNAKSDNVIRYPESSNIAFVLFEFTLSFCILELNNKLSITNL